jgi:alpha-D-xyloside xylohydrolase
MWPGDPGALEKDQQYMFGPCLMVAPVVHRSGKKSVYLPEGAWIDYWTGERLNGPRNLHLQVPLETLPLYVREGAIIPCMHPAMRIPQGRIDPLILDIYPSAFSSYSIREEEGNTNIRVAGSADGTSVQWNGPVKRRFIIRVHVQDGAGKRIIERETDVRESGSELFREK